MAYTLLDLQTAVSDDLKDPNFSINRITRYLNYGQQVIFNTHLFQFCEKSVIGALTIGQYVFAQQADHQSTIGGVLVNPAAPLQRIILDKDSYLPHRQFFEYFPDPSSLPSVPPRHWTEFANQIYFSAPVDKAYTFIQRYYKTPVDLSLPADIPTVPVSFRELLEFYADYRAEKYRGNHDIAATYLQQFEDGLETMTLRYSPTQSVAPATMRGATRRAVQ